MLDVNGQSIGDGTLELVKFAETASAVNEITVTNSATGNAPEIASSGDDTNIDLKLTPKGTGKLNLDGIKFPNADGSAGQALTTNGSGILSFSTISADGTADWDTTVKTTGFTATANKGYFCNTTSAEFTVTLPATPSAGDEVIVLDYAGTFDTNKLTISPNGGKIEGLTINHQLTGEREGVRLVYIDSTQGWLAYSGINEGTDALAPVPYSVDFLVIAGGGGAGGNGTDNYSGGGGGAGGYRNSYSTETSGGGGSSEASLSFAPGVVYTVTVGAGGAGGGTTPNENSGVGTVGSNSSISGTGISTITSTGGGGGGSSGGGAGGPASSGGSGGGANVEKSQGSGTANQGFAGVKSTGTSGAGGGGGASQTPTANSGNNGGNGGNGLASSITGSSVLRGGGGAGGTYGGTAGTGGTGGGGNGSNTAAGSAGTANTGGGGGAGRSNTGTGYVGGAGGKGVVILRLPTASYSGTTTGSPTVTTDGSDKVIVFNDSGSITG
jgi:hypothetical protein